MDNWPPTKTAIYYAAVDVFSAKGFDAASVQDVADIAGLTKGALYHYFDSKEALLQVITQVAMKRNVDGARQIVAEGRSPRETVRLLIEQTLSGLEFHRREMTLFLDQWRREQTSLPGTKRLRDEYETIIDGVIAQGIEDEEFEPVADVRLLSFALLGLCMHAQYWWRPNDPLSATQLADVFTRILLNGIGKRTSRR